MGPRFDETPRGRRFFESDLPKLIKAIQEQTAEMKRANDLREAEYRANGIDLLEYVSNDNGSENDGGKG